MIAVKHAENWEKKKLSQENTKGYITTKHALPKRQKFRKKIKHLNLWKDKTRDYFFAEAKSENIELEFLNQKVNEI